MELSVVVPIYNEVENIGVLHDEICQALDGVCDFEMLFVDDGSTDGTPDKLQALKNDSPRLRGIRHINNAGQSTAIITGVSYARSDWIATLDGDGQNDPADIPRLLTARDLSAEQDQAAVMYAGYRKKRNDNWLKRISSRGANAIRSRILHDSTPDTGCGLKLFRRDAFLVLPRFDHMHRFLPALIQRDGGRVEIVEVHHRARVKGVSKYGFHNRLWVGIVDLIGVAWLQRRRVRVETTEVENK